MAEWHLQDIRNALEARGWRIIAEHPGDDYRISVTWELERSTKKPLVFIDFHGLDDLVTLTLEQSYGCCIRGHGSLSLYFGRKGERGSRRQQNWQSDLEHFINELDRVGN